MNTIESNINLNKVEELYGDLSKDLSDKAELILPKEYKNKDFFEVPSYIQYLSSWFRKNKNAKVILPFEDGNLVDKDSFERFFEEEPNYVASILGWNGDICDLNGNNIKPLIKSYTTDIRSQMNSLQESTRMLQKGGILFLTCFDHFAERNGLLNSFYINRNTFYPSNAFEFSPFVERLSFFATSFNKGIAVKNLSTIFKDITGMIYELMLNTHEWARTDENYKELNPNIRGVYLKFHKASVNTYLKKTEKDKGLHSFFNEPRFSKNVKGETYLLELSVFDSGPGFIRRYTSNSSDQLTIEEQVSIIKKCLTLHQTSASGERGVVKGAGLDRVQQILDGKGFLRIRTGKCSLYRDMYKIPYEEVTNSDQIKLYDWKTDNDKVYSELSEVQGTLISIIYPYEI